jgi:hypothetical protein
MKNITNFDVSSEGPRKREKHMLFIIHRNPYNVFFSRCLILVHSIFRRRFFFWQIWSNTCKRLSLLLKSDSILLGTFASITHQKQKIADRISSVKQALCTGFMSRGQTRTRGLGITGQTSKNSHQNWLNQFKVGESSVASLIINSHLLLLSFYSRGFILKPWAN